MFDILSCYELIIWCILTALSSCGGILDYAANIYSF